MEHARVEECGMTRFHLMTISQKLGVGLTPEAFVDLMERINFNCLPETVVRFPTEAEKVEFGFTKALEESGPINWAVASQDISMLVRMHTAIPTHNWWLCDDQSAREHITSFADMAAMEDG